MHHKTIGAGQDDRASSTVEEDAKTESAVLGFVLEEHPAHLTIPELSLAINRYSPGEFSSEDAVERAIRNLVGAGLLYIGGGMILPTRAARYFNCLEVR